MTIRPSDFFGASPKTVLNKPFFHAQDQKAYNVDGGSSIADAWTKRTLNTVIYNDIQGASLANNEVSLPAGTYLIEGSALFGMVTAAQTILAVFKDETKALQGTTMYGQTNVYVQCEVSGIVVLSAPGVVDLRYYVGVASAGVGLGRDNNSGSITDTSIPSIYADLKIWQLDRSLEIAPVAVNSGLQTVPGLNTEGHVMGFDMLSMTGNTLTYEKGSCLDSTLTIPIAFTTTKNLVLPSTANGSFYIFAVRLTDGVTCEPRAYTSLGGPASDNQIDAWQLIDYAKNNGSGVTMPFRQVRGFVEWLTTERPIITSSTTTSWVSYSLSAVLPISILEEIRLYYSAGTQWRVSYDGVMDILGQSALITAILPIIPVNNIYFRTDSVSNTVRVHGIKLRR